MADVPTSSQPMASDLSEPCGLERRAFLRLAAGSTLLAIVSVTGGTSLMGCGGGGGTPEASPSPTLVPLPPGGTAHLSVEWAARSPGRLAVTGAAAYLMVNVHLGLASSIHSAFGPFERPEGDGPVTSTMTVGNLPQGTVTLAVLAYPADVNGQRQEPLAIGRAGMAVLSGQTVSIAMTPYVASTLDRIEVRDPAGKEVTAVEGDTWLKVGEEKSFTGAALNAAGKTLLLSPTQLLWSTESNALTLVGGSTGLSITVRGVAVSTAGAHEKVTIRDSESGKTASFFIGIRSAVPLPKYRIRFLFKSVPSQFGWTRSASGVSSSLEESLARGRQTATGDTAIHYSDLNNKGEVAWVKSNGETLLRRADGTDTLLPLVIMPLYIVLLNDHSQVVSNEYDLSGGRSRIRQWDNGVVTTLATTELLLMPRGINNNGLVACEPIPGDRLHSIGYQTRPGYGDTLEEIPLHPGPGHCVSSDNTVVGFTGSLLTPRPILWRNTGGARTLPTNNNTGTGFFADAISDSGRIIGMSRSLNGAKDAPVRWDSPHFTLIPLEPLPGFDPSDPSSFYSARAVNGPGDIVGTQRSSGADGFSRAIIWRGDNTVPEDLNTQLPDNSGWVLERATAINDAGQILGEGKYNGETAVFLMTPEG